MAKHTYRLWKRPEDGNDRIIGKNHSRRKRFLGDVHEKEYVRLTRPGFFNAYYVIGYISMIDEVSIEGSWATKRKLASYEPQIVTVLASWIIVCGIHFLLIQSRILS